MCCPTASGCSCVGTQTAVLEYSWIASQQDNTEFIWLFQSDKGHCVAVSRFLAPPPPSLFTPYSYGQGVAEPVVTEALTCAADEMVMLWSMATLEQIREHQFAVTRELYPDI
jgi:hypothetical protein